MSNSFLNWSGRADIEGRVTERRCPQLGWADDGRRLSPAVRQG